MKPLLILALLSIYSAQAQDNTFLKGKITNPTSKKCYLSTQKIDEKTGARNEVILDSSEIKSDGTFAMSIKLQTLTEATFSDDNEGTSMLLDKGDDIYLILNTKMFDETISYSGKGSEKNNAIRNIFLIKEKIYYNIFQNDWENSSDTTGFIANAKKEYAQLKELMEDYRKEMPALNEFVDSQNKIIENLIQGIRENFAFKAAMAALKGTDILAFEGVDLKGNKLNISTFKGKITVIDFWATWCGPCKAEFPSMKKLEEQYGATINFLSVGVSCEKDDWTKMAADLNFKHNMFLGKEEAKEIKSKYSIKFIPRYIVVDKDLKIIDANGPRPSSGNLQKYFTP